jgi:tetratricopeptide (TPR) repeat protein
VYTGIPHKKFAPPHLSVKKFVETSHRTIVIWKTTMRGSYKFLLSLFLLVSFAGAMGQPHEHESHGMSSEKLGNVSFPTTCSAQVQSEFEIGVASLHSFEYDKATQHFNDVLQRDPNCAIAHWGQAMALYHQLWNTPSESDLAEGWQIVRKGQAASEQSPREKEYIQAMAVFYEPGKQSAQDRATAYSQAMRRLHEGHPSDEEATVFYALSLLAAEPPNDTSLQYAKKAVGLLNGVLATDPQHPGVAHYLIHACDNPGMAQDGLGAAKRYATIAPSSPHALHMPSHIFARLGLWQDDISSNLAAVAAAEHGPSGTEARLHPMDFIEYAYLQTGQDDKARAVEAEAVALKNEGFTRGLEPYYFYVQAHFPALLVLETHDWKGAELLQPIAGANPRIQSITYWAQAVGAGHLGDIAAARAAVHNLDEALEADKKMHPDSPAPPVDTNKNEAHAWLAFAEKDSIGAFQLLKPVIQFQDEVGKGEVELPAREMYADMLLELNHPTEALEQYGLSLKSDPNRFNGLYGAGRSAELADQKTLAGTYYKQLLDNCDQGTGSDRPELQHARRFVDKTASSTIE